MTRPFLALLLSLAGCTETIRLDHSALDNLSTIEVIPAAALVEITDLASPRHTLQYAAVGTFSDGSTRDITDVVTWAIDRDVLGGFDPGGLFVASHAAAGYGIIAARVNGVQAVTSLRITIDATIIDATFPPPGANLFSSTKEVVTGDPTHSPSLLYPSDGTWMPRLIASTLFQLDGGTGNNAFRVSFENAVLRLRVETGADRWRADGTIQRLIAASAGFDSMRVSIEATTDMAPIYAGAPLELNYSDDLSNSELYYCSASASGIMRAAVDLASASKVYPSDGTCVGCHAVSRDGHLALGVDSGTGTTFQLEAFDVETQMATIPASAARPMGWAAYSPDATRLVVANDGVLTLYDARTGDSLGIIPLPAQRYATHPDWSPDGRSIAVAYTSQSPTNMDVRAASIAVLHFDGSWSAPEVVVNSTGPDNYYFPRWSPDGSMIAYVRATTASRGAASAELMLVSATGGAPTALALANKRVGPDDIADLANTMPSWAPRLGSRLWLAFASARPYGKVVTGGPSQIWITSLDLSKPGDPTTPAFWLPSQDVTVLNYNPVWLTAPITTL